MTAALIVLYIVSLIAARVILVRRIRLSARRAEHARLAEELDAAMFRGDVQMYVRRGFFQFAPAQSADVWTEDQL